MTTKKHCTCGKNAGAKDGDVCPSCGELVTPASIPRQGKPHPTAMPAVESNRDRALRRLMGEKIEDAGGPIGNRMKPLEVCKCEDAGGAKDGDMCPICGNIVQTQPADASAPLPPTHRDHPRFKLKFESVACPKCHEKTPAKSWHEGASGGWFCPSCENHVQAADLKDSDVQQLMGESKKSPIFRLSSCK